MIQRVALLVGAVGACAVLAGAIAFGGFDASVTLVDDAIAADSSPELIAATATKPPLSRTPSPTPSPTTKVVVDNVYVLPTTRPPDRPQAAVQAASARRPNATASPNATAEPNDDRGGHDGDDDRGDDDHRDGDDGHHGSSDDEHDNSGHGSDNSGSGHEGEDD